MKMLSRTILMAGMLFISGCVSEEIPTQIAMGVPDGKISYAPVPAKGLKLKMISKPLLYAGEEALLNFALSNESGKEVRVPEWFSVEENNIRLLIQVRLTGMDQPDPDGWMELPPDTSKPVLHYPLVLMPGNQVIVGKKLSFIEKMQISPGHERRFYVQGKSALQSLELSTAVMELRVLPQRAGKEGKKK